MFGGVGVYSDGLIFGLIDDDRFFLKVDDVNRPDFEERGTGKFDPYGDGRGMQYYEVPADVLEDRAELARWSRRAIDVAQRAQAKKPGWRRRKR